MRSEKSLFVGRAGETGTVDRQALGDPHHVVAGLAKRDVLDPVDHRLDVPPPAGRRFRRPSGGCGSAPRCRRPRHRSGCRRTRRGARRDRSFRAWRCRPGLRRGGAPNRRAPARATPLARSPASAASARVRPHLTEPPRRIRSRAGRSRGQGRARPSRPPRRGRRPGNRAGAAPARVGRRACRSSPRYAARRARGRGRRGRGRRRPRGSRRDG